MINDMKPGPNLDREIAELLGMEIRSEQQDVQRLQQAEHEIGVIAWYGIRWILRRRGKESMTWAPSSNWDSMAVVIGEMQRRGYGVAIQSGGLESEWSVMFFGGPTREAYDSDGDTVPHAVTMAAIKAIQGEDTQCSG